MYGITRHTKGDSVKLSQFRAFPRSQILGQEQAGWVREGPSS